MFRKILNVFAYLVVAFGFVAFIYLVPQFARSEFSKKKKGQTTFPSVVQWSLNRDKADDKNEWFVVTRVYEDNRLSLPLADAMLHSSYHHKDEATAQQLQNANATVINHRRVKVGDMVKIQWQQVNQRPGGNYQLPIIVEVK